MRKNIILMGGLIVIILLGYLAYEPETDEEPLAISTNFSEEKLEGHSLGEEGQMYDFIYVHISGAVAFPGMIEMEEGARLLDAIELAGGLLDDADMAQINLARVLRDEEKVHIPFVGEMVSPYGGVEATKINVNFASKEELCVVPGIGPATADSIMEYRKENKIKDESDLLNIPGIGEKKVEQFKSHICY